MTGLARQAELLAHKRILASAGAGKTFQLTNRYLALIASGADIGSILSSTFTRLAAGEIRNRILLRLAEAADDEEKRVELGSYIGLDALSRDQTLQLLAYLARNVHRMNIRTLDGFFASVVGAFALELGLPSSSRMIDEPEDAQFRARAIEQMLDERNPQKLIDLLRLLTQGSSERSALAAIDTVVSKLYELYRDAAPEAWEQIPDYETLSMSKLVEAIVSLQDCPLPDNKSIIKAHAADLERIATREWGQFIAKGIAGAVVAEKETFSRVKLPSVLVQAYEPLVKHAIGVLVGRVRKQTLATRDLLELFHDKYARLKHRRRVMTFADLTAAMIEAERVGSLDDICYRLDASIRHLLLDEFQDTSVAQWRSLSPFIEEIVGNEPPEHSFFCVGDVKQSIYGWREAAPEILLNMPDLIGGGVDEQSLKLERLSTSYRSAPVIMDTLNRVFNSLKGNAALIDRPEVAEQWEQWFSTHETTKDFNGYAELRIAPRARETSWQGALRLKRAAKLAASLHFQAPSRSIAILTRTNAAVANLLFELNKLEIPASGRGGGPLTDAAPVNAILDLLHLADHPGDTIAAFNVAFSPLVKVFNIDTRLADPKAIARREALARKVRRTLLEKGCAHTISEWVRAIAPSCNVEELRRALQLVELAERHEDTQSLRPGDFVRLVEATNMAQSRPAPVQVMTVHQSKGLEFDMVVLPELESKLTGSNSPEVVFERSGITEGISCICRYMKKEIRTLVPELEPMFEQERNRTVRESLCVLYVAMTRARQGLYMIIDPPKDNEKTLPKTIASLLRCTLAQGPLEPDRIVYACGDESWLDAHSEPVATVESPRQIDRIELASGERTPRFGMVAPPASMHTESTPLAEQLRLRDDEASDRGTVIHGLFEQIEWIEDWKPDETMLLEIARRLAPHRAEPWLLTCMEEFMAMIKRPGVREVLSRGDRDPDRLKIWRELPFARIIEGRVQQGRIDRLVAELDASGKPQRATVIDYKTDRIDREQAVSEAERYRDQLESYRHPAARRIGIEVEAVSAIILFLSADIAVPVG